MPGCGLLGGTVAALGWFALTGREEVWPVGRVRLIAVGLVVGPSGWPVVRRGDPARAAFRSDLPVVSSGRSQPVAGVAVVPGFGASPGCGPP